MTTLADKNSRDALGIDTIERGIAYASHLLKSVAGTEVQFAQAVKYNSPNLVGTLNIKITIDYTASDFFASGSDYLEGILPITELTPVEQFTPLTSSVSGFDIPNDDVSVTSLEHYLVWLIGLYEEIYLSAVPPQLDRVAITGGESATRFFRTFAVKLDFDPIAYKVSRNMLEAINGNDVIIFDPDDSDTTVSWGNLSDKPPASYYKGLLESLTQENRLDASAIKNLPDVGVGNWDDLGGKPEPSYYRGLLETLTGVNRLDASAIKNLPSAGINGQAATITVGNVVTGAPDSNVVVTNAGTNSAAILNFSIPRGATGAIGTTPNISVGSVTQVANNLPLEVTVTGTAAAPVLNFQIPQGQRGERGLRGFTGGLGYNDIVVANLNNVASGATVAFALTLPSSMIIYRVVSSSAVRLRQYLTATYRSNDLLRASTTLIQGDHGCYFDIITRANNSFIRNFAPPAIALSDGTGYFSLTNLEATLQETINVEITLLPLES